MRFTAERESILSALAFVAKYAAAKDTIPILTQVLLRAEESHIVVTATDLDRVAEDSFRAEISIPGAICLQADLLARSVKGASGSEVSLVSDGREATLTCGNTKFKLPIQLAVDFPATPMLSKEVPYCFDLPAATIHKAKSAVGFASDNSTVRYWLNGISWAMRDGMLEFCATDHHQLSLLSVPAPITEIPSIIVPEFEIPAWGGDVSVSISGQFIRLVNGNQMLASKLIQGTFPPYHGVIPDNKNVVLFDRAEMLGAIARARLVAEEREHSILFSGKDGSITVSARTSRGETFDTVPCDGEDFRIAVAAGVIAPILKSFDCEVMEWRIADHFLPSTLHDPNDASRVAIAMPYHDVRITDVREAA